MVLSVHTEASTAVQDSDGETTLVTISSVGVFQLACDLSDLANGESVTFRIKGKARDVVGDTARVFYQSTFGNAQGPEVNKLSIPVPVAHTQGVLFTVETDGAAADINLWWSVYEF